ncbi:SDR family oxidoreductase [Pseudomonas citrulli]|uniref:SDR family oxidoreductase n=1 Tax=Pseudomonas TaxID=286 RepID=UPI001364C9AC|nr:SDR family oxidoreductase [Pseudomonas simiae]
MPASRRRSPPCRPPCPPCRRQAADASSTSDRYGEGINEGLAAYNAAAWSLVGLTRTAALDWGRYQIASNLLLPLADTPELRRSHERRPGVIDLMIGQLPLGRLGDPVEGIGAAALFLACDACAFVNGEVIHADGGQHVAGPVLNPARFG